MKFGYQKIFLFKIFILFILSINSTAFADEFTKCIAWHNGVKYNISYDYRTIPDFKAGKVCHQLAQKCIGTNKITSRYYTSSVLIGTPYQRCAINPNVLRPKNTNRNTQVKNRKTRKTNGNIYFYQDLARNGNANWANNGKGIKVGSGWGRLKNILDGGNGIIYTVNLNGDLYFYRYIAKYKRMSGGKNIGSGWGSFKHVFGGDQGVIYAIKSNGDLYFYRDLARNGNAHWANNGQGRKIGSGWGSFKHVFSGNDGIIYAIKTNGDLYFYRDLARNGNAHWANNGQGRKIGSGWGSFKHVFNGNDGIIYTIKSNGDLYFYRDLARNGNAHWANNGQGRKIGSGWGSFRSVFEGDGGIIYGVKK